MRPIPSEWDRSHCLVPIPENALVATGRVFVRSIADAIGCSSGSDSLRDGKWNRYLEGTIGRRLRPKPRTLRSVAESSSPEKRQIENGDFGGKQSGSKWSGTHQTGLKWSQTWVCWSEKFVERDYELRFKGFTSDPSPPNKNRFNARFLPPPKLIIPANFAPTFDLWSQFVL